MIETIKRLMQVNSRRVFAPWSCVALCPDDLWNAPSRSIPLPGRLSHCFSPTSPGPDAESQRRQPFHLANPKLFGDYEQLEYREPNRSTTNQRSGALRRRGKAVATLAAETEEDLCAPAKFARRNFSRAELHVYSIRHIQHHAAQLILRLRLDSDVDIPWIGAGWCDPAPIK